MGNNSINSKNTQNLTANLPSQTGVRPPARPLWLSTIGYFAAAVLASSALFLLVLNLLSDESEHETPWLSAGIAAAALFGLAMFAREIVLRRARNRLLLRSARFDVPPISKKPHVSAAKKFSLEQNASALRLIEKKSREAENSVDATEKHFEIFKMCGEYLGLVEKELGLIHIGSPRLPALRNGQERVQMLHKKHLLSWAAEATRKLTREAAVRVEVNDKVESAQRALEVLDSALQIYPNERQLLESAAAVREFVVSIRVSHLIELAERAAFKGHYRRAIDYYTDAQFYLTREAVADSSLMQEKLDGEIERLRQALANKKNGRGELPFNN